MMFDSTEDDQSPISEFVGFDNTAPPSPTRWEMLKDHLPILLIAGGVITLFISLHTAAIAVAVAAGLHVAIGVAVVAITWLRSTSGSGR